MIFGLRAGIAVVERRPDAVLAFAFDPAAVKAGPGAHALAMARARGIACHEASPLELERLAHSSHHEGVCVTAEPRRWASPNELADLLVRTRGAAIALDRVRNPYNVGAILRSAAFFGLEAALLGAPAPHPALAPDAVRVAEGGAEHLMLSRTTDLATTLARLRARGVHVVGGESDGTTASVFDYAFPRPLVLVVGNEREGVGPTVRAQCDELITIPGTGAVGSLNVSIAASVLVAELARSRSRS